MTVNASIPLSGRSPNILDSVTGGVALGESMRTSGVREQILKNQEQAQAISLAQQRGAYINQLATGLIGKPMADRAAVVAQQLPMLERMGVNPSEILGSRLDDQSLRAVIAQTQPFIDQKQQQIERPAAIETFEYYQDILNNPNSTEDQKKAARIALKLDAPAREFAPKIVDIGGIKYLQIGKDLYNPTTYQPVEVDATGLSATQEITPEQQIETRAELESATTTATETAKQDVRQESQENIDMRIKSTQANNQALDIINIAMTSKSLGDVTGMIGSNIPYRARLSETKDFLNHLGQLDSILTASNLDIMSGVLSESDIKIISGIANNLGLKKDEKGNVIGINGSMQGTIEKLETIDRAIRDGMIAKGIYPIGTQAVDSNGVIYEANGMGQFVDANGNPYPEGQ